MLNWTSVYIANDVVDVVATIATFGLASVFTVAEAVAVREAIAESLSIAEGDVASLILSAANQSIDNLVNSLVNPFIDGVSRGVESAVDSYIPQFVLSQSLALQDSVADRLHLSPSDLDNCVQNLYESSQHLSNASQKLDKTVSDLFEHPAASPQVGSLSSALRMVVKGVVESVEHDLVDALHQLIDHIIGHFVKLLQDYSRAISEVDQQARATASSEHIGLGPQVVVISAAGVGAQAAYEVVSVSGTINADQAERVRVESVVFVEEIESLSVTAPGAPAVPAQVATSVDSASHLESKVSATVPKVAPANADTSASNLSSINSKTHASGPHVSAAPTSSGTNVHHVSGSGAEQSLHGAGVLAAPHQQNEPHHDGPHSDSSERAHEEVQASDGDGNSHAEDSAVGRNDNQS